MKTTKRLGYMHYIAVAVVMELALLSTGCQTTVPVSYTKPARLDMNGISTLGIISNSSSATSAIVAALTTGKYTVVSGGKELAELRRWQRQQSIVNSAMEINAADLVKAYSSNAVRANQSYGRKTIKISGTVTEIQTSAVRLGVGSNSVDVYFNKSEIEKVSTLDKGENVILVGECIGLDSPDSSDTAEILRILGGGQHVNIVKAEFYIPKYTGAIDAVLTVNMTPSVEVKIALREVAAKNEDGETLKDEDGNIIKRKVEYYSKEAVVNMSYKLVSCANGSLIGEGQRSGSSSTMSYDDKSKLPSNETPVSNAQKKPLEEIISDMIPTVREVSVSLVKTDSKDKEIINAMNAAKKTC